MREYDLDIFQKPDEIEFNLIDQLEFDESNPYTEPDTRNYKSKCIDTTYIKSEYTAQKVESPIKIKTEKKKKPFKIVKDVERKVK